MDVAKFIKSACYSISSLQLDLVPRRKPKGEGGSARNEVTKHTVSPSILPGGEIHHTSGRGARTSPFKIVA